MNACRNPGHASAPADYCAGCARDCERELTALNDRYMRLLGDQAADTRRTYAAARRTAWDHVHGVIGRFYWGGIADTLMPDIRPALYRATQIDPACARNADARDRITVLNEVAGRALAAWTERAAQVAADAAADPREAEVTRLRSLITETGQRLHREAGTPFDGFNPCTCAGCRLIRDMDTAGLPTQEAVS